MTTTPAVLASLWSPPMQVPIDATFTWQGRTLKRTLTLAQSGHTLPILWPDNRLLLRVSRGGQPISGVRVNLAGRRTWSNSAPRTPPGPATILDLPDHAPITASLSRYPVRLVREITLTQPDTTLDVEWPPLAKVTVSLQWVERRAAASWGMVLERLARRRGIGSARGRRDGPDMAEPAPGNRAADHRPTRLELPGKSRVPVQRMVRRPHPESRPGH